MPSSKKIIQPHRFLFALLACAPLSWSQTASVTPPPSYTVGPDDQVSLYVTDLEDNFADKTFRVDQNGDLTLPMIGRFHAAGLTQAELQDQVKTRFGLLLKAPDIVVNVTEFASQPVSVLGAVNKPQIVQLHGGKTLFEVLSLAEGLRPDAGSTVSITRDLQSGAIPLPSATVSSNGQYSIATVHIKDVMGASAENIAMRPGDTVFVGKADVVYAVGSLTSPGGFPIGEKESLSALQVIALAGGLTKTASLRKARILRVVPGSATRAEVPIDLKLLMAGKLPDTPLQPEDILFVPLSGAKAAAYRSTDAIIAAVGYMAVLGRF